MAQLDMALLAAMAGVIVFFTQAARKALGDAAIERFGPFISIGFGFIVAAVYGLSFGVIPPDMSKIGYIVGYGLFAGISAAGGFSAGKRLLTGGSNGAAKLLIFGLLSVGMLLPGCATGITTSEKPHATLQVCVLAADPIIVGEVKPACRVWGFAYDRVLLGASINSAYVRSTGIS